MKSGKFLNSSCSWLEFEFGILTQSADGIFAQICVTFGSSAQSATGSFAQSAVWLETRTFGICHTFQLSSKKYTDQ